MAVVGERLKSIITGKVYEIKLIKGISVVLESEDRKSQILTERENLKFFYEEVESHLLEKSPGPFAP
jgi:hypothetical protein